MSDKEEEEEENMKYPDTSYFSDIEPPPKVDKPKRTRKMTPETLEKLKVAREKAREAQQAKKKITKMEKEIVVKEKQQKIDKITKKHKELTLPKEEPEPEEPKEEPKEIPVKKEKKKKKKPIVIVQEDSSSSSDEDQNVIYIKRRSKKKVEKSENIPIQPREPPREITPPLVRRQIPHNPFNHIQFKQY